MAQQPLHKAICHVDLDAFYAQVEAKQHPELQGKPMGVVQYNPFGNLETRGPSENRVFNNSNGSLIAVSYEARAGGVKRNMRGDQARGICPDLQLVQVPTAHGKADLTVYRSEGRRVLELLARLARTERASIDECYLDLTEEAQRRLAECGGVPLLPPSPEQVHVVQEGGFSAAADWWRRLDQDWEPGERLLACAAAAVAELRAAVLAELGYTCSAGIAHTKLMAKLCSGLHKPAQQTVLPAGAVPALLGPLPLPKLKGLGGKFGEQVMSELAIETVGQLAATPVSRLEAVFGEKDAHWLAALARGATDDAVEQRKLPKSVSCGKTFRGNHALRDLAAVHTWLLELGGELEERLEEDRHDNGRVPQLLTASFSVRLPWVTTQQPGKPFQAPAGYHSTSRSCPLRKLTAEAIAEDATALVRRWASEQGSGWQLSILELTAGSFVPVQSTGSTITRFFKAAGSLGGTDAAAAVVPASTAAAAGGGGPAAETPPCWEQQGQQQQRHPGERTECQHLQEQQKHHQQQESKQAWYADTAPGSSDDGTIAASLVQQDAGTSSSAAAGDRRAAGQRQQQFSQQPPLPFHQQQQQLQQEKQRLEGEIDEAVLAELPPELQREIRGELKMRQLAAHLEQCKQQAGSADGRGSCGSGVGKKLGGGGGGRTKRPSGSSAVGSSSSSNGVADSMQSIVSFLKGKRTKR